jgi:uncharacterized membrane protein
MAFSQWIVPKSHRNLRMFRYDKDAKIFEASFMSNSSKIYTYHNVPLLTVLQLENTDSPGSYFHKAFKQNKIKFTTREATAEDKV